MPWDQDRGWPPLLFQAERNIHSSVLKNCFVRSQHLNVTSERPWRKGYRELIKARGLPVGKLHSHHRAASAHGHPSLGDMWRRRWPVFPKDPWEHGASRASAPFPDGARARPSCWGNSRSSACECGADRKFEHHPHSGTCDPTVRLRSYGRMKPGLRAVSHHTEDRKGVWLRPVGVLSAQPPGNRWMRSLSRGRS